MGFGWVKRTGEGASHSGNSMSPRGEAGRNVYSVGGALGVVSNFSQHHDRLDGSTRLLGSSPRVLTQYIWNGAWNFYLLTIS